MTPLEVLALGTPVVLFILALVDDPVLAYLLGPLPLGCYLVWLAWRDDRPPGRTTVRSTCLHSRRCERPRVPGSIFCGKHRGRYLRQLEGEELEERKEMFYQAWQAPAGQINQQDVRIKAIYDVHHEDRYTRFKRYAESLGDVAVRHGHFENPGNQRYRYHGTRRMCDFNGQPCQQKKCTMCLIIRNGFDMRYASAEAFFGQGIYATAASSTGCRYAKERGSKKITGAVFAVHVACGDAQVLNGRDLADSGLVGTDKPWRPWWSSLSCLLACLLAGKWRYDARIVNEPQESWSYRDLAARKGPALLESSDEVVVFQNEAIAEKYMILFGEPDGYLKLAANTNYAISLQGDGTNHNDGAKIHLWTVGSPQDPRACNQQWVLEDGYIKLAANKNYAISLKGDGTNHNDGAEIHLWTVRSPQHPCARNQQWVLEDGYLKLAANKNYAISLEGDGTNHNNGAKIHLRTVVSRQDPGARNQQFLLS